MSSTTAIDDPGTRGAFRCLLCAGAANALVLRKPDVALVRCRRCRFVQQHPVPEASGYHAHYEADGGSYSTELLRDKELFLRRDRRVLADLAGLGGDGPLLDVGAGAGVMLEAARERGWHATGIELAAASVAHIRALGFPVLTQPIEVAPVEARSLGVVTMSHSLEHFTDPAAALRRAATLLRPGGLLHIAVPHWRAAKRWVAGREIPWIFRDHVSYFTKATLERAVTDAGFAVLTCRTVPMECDVDFRFAVITMERFGLDRLVRRFLRMGDRRLATLLTDHVAVDCPPWRFRFVVRLCRALLRAWPERLLGRLGLAEELRLTARCLARE